MKRFILLFLFGITIARQSQACVDYSVDGDYYNLFMQEIIDDPRYYPFLLCFESAYYESKYPAVANENIEEWQAYLKLSYDDAYYLVFIASRDHISAAIGGKPVADQKLKFLTPEFTAKHKQALLYLAYAKYLEPYMRITHSSDSDWDYFPEDTKTADKLDYNKVMNVLQRSWAAETDKELKLRYGYQLVRFAHYNRNYDEAIRLFDKYVASLDYKPAMYYHALAQKAGAVRGNSGVLESNALFFEVFVHSKNLKEMALNSIRLSDDTDFNYFTGKAKTNEERNDAYLLLGYMEFNNPLSEIEKITATTPDAIQAKVLMARAVNQIERDVMQVYQSWEADKLQQVKDRRFPIASGSAFLKQTLALAKKMAESTNVKDKGFWNITTAYLHFLNKDFAAAKTMLAKVTTSNPKYDLQKTSLAMYIDISEQPQITPALEAEWYAKYADVLQATKPTEYYQNTPQNFVVDVLANRYFLQKDYAKSFLLNNNLSALEHNPQFELLDAVEKFYQKSGKNALEKFIAANGNNPNALDYINYLRGIVYLSKGDLVKAEGSFKRASGYKGEGIPEISARIFGYNRIECFECSEEDVVATDYLGEFSSLSNITNYASLTKALLELQKSGNGTDEQAAKANYLLGNFFYNVTPTGYFRHVLRFSDTNSYYSNVYDWFGPKPDIFNNIYFKYYDFYYENDPLPVASQYLEKAYRQASDGELKARIVFALSKCEQEMFYVTNRITGGWNSQSDQVLIKDRKYFVELMKYRQTKFYKEVNTHCMYFEYYVNHYTH